MAATQPMGDTGPLPDVDDLWNYERPAETEQALRDVLARTQDGAPLAYRLELLTQIARTQGLQRRFDDAHATLDGVEAELPQPGDPRARPRIRYLLERGRVFNSSGRREEARPLFLTAWELAAARGEDELAVDAAHMLGIAEARERQLAWNQRALELAQRSPDPRAQRWQGSLYNNIGWYYHDAGEYAQALALFEQAQAYWEAEGDPARLGVARWAVARALRSVGRVPEALARQRTLLVDHEAARQTDGFVLEEIGECLLTLGRGVEARPFFVRAHEELAHDPWLAEGEAARLERLKRLGAGESE